MPQKIFEGGTTLHYIQKKIALQAGFLVGVERFNLLVDPEDDGSWWNWRHKRIQIGVMDMPKDKLDPLSYLLMRHETGHVRYTVRGDLKMQAHFALVNILEDARVEALDGSDFKPLHQYYYTKCYFTEFGGVDEEKVSNPYNIGALLRWKLHGVETVVSSPKGLTPDESAEFMEDWTKAINSSIAALDTHAVAMAADVLFLKWRKVFESAGDPYLEGGSNGSIEKTSNGMQGQGQPVRGASTIPGHGGSEQGPEVENLADSGFFKEPWFQWDTEWINKQIEIIRNILKPYSKTERIYAMSGRRFDPKRLANPPLPPFKVKTLSKTVMKLNRLLIVIDGSGSMSPTPFRDACHIARVLANVLPSDVVITTSCSSDTPVSIPVSQMDTLAAFSAWGGSENYKSLADMPARYSFTLFLTDACVGDSDQQYVKTELYKIAKVGAGYVGEEENQLTEIFARNFYAKSIYEDVGRMTALFLKRYFTLKE